MTRPSIAACSVLALLWAVGPALAQEPLRVGAAIEGALG